MAKYTRQQLIELLREAGIPEKDIPIMVAIAMAESNGNSEAQGDQKLANNKWGNSVGLFQIRSLRDPSKYSGADNLRDAEKLKDPIYNAKAAWAISKQGTNFNPWTTYEEGTYKNYMDDATTPSRSRVPKVVKGKGKFLAGDLSDILGDIDPEDTVDLALTQYVANKYNAGSVWNKLTNTELTSDEIQKEIMNTTFWKNNIKERRDQILLLAQDPATFNRQLKNAEDEVRQQFISAGANFTEAKVKSLAKKAVFFDLTAEDFTQIIADSLDFTGSYIKGLAGKTVADLRDKASKFGVTLPQNSAELKNAVKDIFTNKRTMDDVVEVYRQEAIKAFPAFKARFEAGATLEDVADPYRRDIADELELNASDINYNDSVLKSALTAVNSKDGSPYAMSRAEVIRLAQNDPRFDKTQKAQRMLITPLLNLVGGQF